jgi:hypothetical protein
MGPPRLARALEAAVREGLSEVARDVEGLEIRLDYDDSIRRGRVRRLELRAAAASLTGFSRQGAARLRVENVRVALDDLLINPLSLERAWRIDPLGAGRVRLEAATISAAHFQEFLEALRQPRAAQIRLEPGMLAVRSAQAGPDVSARVRIVPAPDRPFVLEAERVRFGWLPVPAVLANLIIRHYDPSTRLASRLPVPVERSAP